jgi:hypothetical protein
MQGRFYRPRISLIKHSDKLKCLEGLETQSLKVGGVELSDHDMVDVEVQVRWPDGHEEAVKVDLGLFSDEGKQLWKPCFLKSVHGIELWFCFDQMRAVKVPK